MENEDPFMKSLLPLTRPPWRSVVASLALQAACVLAILTLSYSVAQKVDVESRYFKLTYIKTELVPVRISRPSASPAPRAPVGDVQLAEQPRRPTFQPVLAAPVIRGSSAKSVSVPEIEILNPVWPAPENAALADVRGPAKPREDVRTGTFGNEGSEGASGNGITRGVVVAGLNGGSAGASGIRRKNIVRDSKFDQSVDSPAKTKPQLQESVQPVQIKFKPRPVYTDEARKKQIQGDVVLEVVFLASGQIVISRVVSGLGYGLDEAALDAARHIQFAPARLQDGKPVDAPAKIHIVFQLAS